MFFGPSTIASTLAVIGKALETYGHDSAGLYRDIGVDPEQTGLPGWRLPLGVMRKAWQQAVETSGDPCFGLRVAEQIRPGHLHAFGLAWMASSTVGDAMRRLERYQRILSTALGAQFDTSGDEYVLELKLPGADRIPDEPWPSAPVDAFFGTVLGLCRTLAGNEFSPLRVELLRSDRGAGEIYRKHWGETVTFSAPRNLIRFRPEECDAPVGMRTPELEVEIESIAERYVKTLDASPVVTQVRSIVMDLLPSGRASQAEVAQRLAESVSTLQRRLRSEGTTYREILDGTRRELALHYVEDGRYELSEIAFLLGFADQAGMNRAFKRWTGTSPKKYAESAAGA